MKQITLNQIQLFKDFVTKQNAINESKTSNCRIEPVATYRNDGGDLFYSYVSHNNTLDGPVITNMFIEFSNNGKMIILNDMFSYDELVYMFKDLQKITI